MHQYEQMHSTNMINSIVGNLHIVLLLIEGVGV